MTICNHNNHLIKLFAKYVSLNILGMIGLSCYILADTFFISNRMGADGLTSLNIAISIYSFINGTGLMIGIGGAIRYTILSANGDAAGADRIFTTAALLGIVAGLAFSIFGLLGARSLSYILGARAGILDMTTEYLRILMVCSTLFILNNVLIAFVRNDNAPNLAMVAMLLGSLTNIILDYVFIYPLNMGMPGAALATSIAPAVGIMTSLTHIIKGKNNFHVQKSRIRFVYIKDILKLGVSAFVTEASSGVVLIVFNLLILNISGNIGVAAYGVTANLALVVIAVFTAIGQGSQPLISEFYGRSEVDNYKCVRKYMRRLAFIIGIVVIAGILAGAGALTSIFNSEGNVVLQSMSEYGMRIYFTGFICAGLNIVMATYLSSTENGTIAFVISIARGFVGILIFAVFLSFVFGMTGVWLAFPVTEVVTFICAEIYIRIKHYQ